MPTRVQDRYQAIAAILDHATLSMRHNTDGGAWSEWLADLVILITKRYPSLLVEWQQDKEARVGRHAIPRIVSYMECGHSCTSMAYKRVRLLRRAYTFHNGLFVYLPDFRLMVKSKVCSLTFICPLCFLQQLKDI